MKRTLAMLLCIIMTLGCMATYSAAQELPGAKEDGTIDPHFKYDEPVHVTSFFEISPALQTWNQEECLNSVYYKRMNEETNIFIDWEWFAQQTEQDSVQKKNMAIASGEIPDFMIVNSAQLSLLAKSDLINRNMGEVFNQYASPELVAWTTGEGPAAFESATFKGDVIAIPLVDSSIDGSDMMWIRRDWLKKLNLEAPKTMEEFYNVMIAFRDQDPDGNGQNDTIGIALHKNFLSAGLGDCLGMFNGFGAYPGAWISDGNGGLVYGSVAAENKDALAFLAKMYTEGLIEQDFSANDEVKGTEACAAGKAGIQYGMLWNCNWPLNASVQNDINADWIAIPIPSATGKDATPQIALRVTGYAVVSKNCAHPEAIVRMLNYWVQKFYYSGDEYNDFLVEDSAGVLNFPQHWVMLKTWSPLRNLESHWKVSKAIETGDTSELSAEQKMYYDSCQQYITGSDVVNGFGGMKTFGNDNSGMGAIDYYYKNNLFMFDAFTTAPTKTMSSKMSTVTDKVMEYYTKVIMGEASLDNFDAFIDEVNALGLKDITAEVNEWYTNK